MNDSFDMFKSLHGVNGYRVSRLTPDHMNMIAQYFPSKYRVSVTTTVLGDGIGEHETITLEQATYPLLSMAVRHGLEYCRDRSQLSHGSVSIQELDEHGEIKRYLGALSYYKDKNKMRYGYRICHGVINPIDKHIFERDVKAFDQASAPALETLSSSIANAANSLFFSLGLNTAASSASASKKSPLTIKDSHGDNYVDQVERIHDRTIGEGYAIKGRNTYGESRVIYLYENGQVKGYQNSDNLGEVGKQMYKFREQIFKHFSYQLPACHQPHAAAGIGRPK